MPTESFELHNNRGASSGGARMGAVRSLQMS